VRGDGLERLRLLQQASRPTQHGVPVNACASDQAPAVASTSPAGGSVEVAVNADVTITFSEAVNVTGGWFSISCVSSGAHTATVSGGPTTFTLNPDADFTAGESCTVTVSGAQVSDQDADDSPDTMLSDFAFDLTTVLPVTPIHDIQGAAHLSSLVGSTVKTQGIVTVTRGNGFYAQDPSRTPTPRPRKRCLFS
jgi:uncharacterized protein